MELVEFYRVALICEAAPDIACGIRAKPVLSRLARHKAIAGAWLDRTGTVLAVRWKSASEKDDSTVRSAFADEECACAQKLTNEDQRHALADAFARGEGWYAGTDVDRLSAEEATIIAARMVERLAAKTTVDSDLADRLKRGIAQACNRVLTTGTPGTRESREQRLRAALLGAARSQLTDDQYRLLEQAVAVAAHRPLPHER